MTTTYNDWENLVKKQLKTENIFEVLNKKNLEGLSVKPFYTETESNQINLPKVEDSTHLVSVYNEHAGDNVYAFLLNQNVENLEEKTLFINNKQLAEHIKPEDDDQYFSLIDVIDENRVKLDEQLAKELLAKDFKRNICIDVAYHQNAGAAMYQQLAVALSKAKELVEFFDHTILEKLIFRIAVGGNYFFEIAKIRALKLLFNQLSKEYDLDLIPYIFVESSLRNKAKNDEENNLIRSTLELASAMVAGADAVFANNFKLENYNPLSEEISFKQQIILAYESIINVFDDASNGSYYIEDITQQLCEMSWQFFIQIEEVGGYLEMLKQGLVQKKIYEHAIKEQIWVEEGKIKLIGVNLYPSLEKKKSVSEMYDEKTIKPVRWAEMFE